MSNDKSKMKHLNPVNIIQINLCKGFNLLFNFLSIYLRYI